ncbi:Cellobiose phosphorylase [Chitinophaga sp. CF118]|uniref:GH36-type glycosyl hydrolase domain-containing protein n=1 Tax=Chitinophaga sp. CF118 TaxID=1884367 RepID=UPI0008F3AC78|nr:glucoamylase family protein [Chitinophaga sp. CF118]SFD59497.1 Cellobiose phosphorylase [Chitinophaga sp. CF118]
MKVTTSTVFDILSRLRVYFQRDTAIRIDDIEEPFRSELYSSDQMNRHGQVVARSHKLMKRNVSDLLLKRLDNNEKILLEVRNLLVESIRSGKTITPAGEWLLDNFYLIEEQVVIAKKHLPKGYSEGLPYLAEGISAGMPRVYDIVLEIIAHSDGRVDVKSLSSFIVSYQTHSVLALGELWAIPIMLRLAVIENLRRVSGKIALDMIDRDMADYWSEKMMTIVTEEPGNLILTIADMVRSKPALTGPFVAAFTRTLQGKGPVLALPLNWMEQQLSGMGVNSNDLVRQENQKQAADQVSVSNSIGTLRFLGATDWREFVEALSSVEHVLRQDATYPLMDFSTRDRYRHVVEKISKASPLSETDVAEKAIALTAPEGTGGQSHVGYYLVDKGVRSTEQISGMRYTIKQKLQRIARKMPVTLYLASIFSLTLIMAGAMCLLAYENGTDNWWILSLLGLITLSCAGQLAVSLVNWFCTIWVGPTSLPRMDFSKGIPEEYRSLVIIPTMLSSVPDIEELVEALEIRFLANREANLHFGLLTDFMDADTAVMPADDELLDLAVSRITALNQKYKQPDLFFLFHRHRTWNSRERKWMGYERKRGKLYALNAFLRGKGRDAFSLIIGGTTILNQVKYVITLDTDTQLPREAAWKFIATMAHPLNRAIYNPQKGRVTYGYGILQPRVDSGIPKQATSLYLRMQGYVSGIDPYTRVSSDVYQDVFGEGSFIGKGIYDVDVFQKTLHNVLPQNRILSHDLLEGCYARAGLLSDVLLYEENPAQYSSDVKRHHRWIRGDWQIGAWMLPFVTNGKGHIVRNKLSGLSRWKIFDNLRRSFVPFSMLLLLLCGWTILPLPWFWTLVVTVIILLPVMTVAAWQLIHKPTDITLKAHLQEVGIFVRDVLLRFVFGLTVLPYEAFMNMNAVILTNWRMIISKRHLLQWTTSATAARNMHYDVWSVYRSMWIAPLLAIVSGSLFLYMNQASFFIAYPILSLWLLAPALSWRLSIPEAEETNGLDEDQSLFLHRTARKTWAFFEQFVTVRENWLPPDNFQEQPVAVIAHRTSPTNMGLAILANLTAYDFGYIGGGELVTRSYHALQSMDKLERYRGHFYNWYNTETLRPLYPRYVSTVDSGNLLGHLLTLRQGLISLPEQPVFSNNIYQGLITTADIIRGLSVVRHSEIIQKIQTVLIAADREMSPFIHIVKDHLDELVALTNVLAEHHGNGESDIIKWTNRLLLQLKNIRDDLQHLTPWMKLLPIPERFPLLEITGRISSLEEIKEMSRMLLPHIGMYLQEDNTAEEIEWLTAMLASLEEGSNQAEDRIMLLEEMEEQCEQFSDVEYDFLFNKSTSLLRIGYNVEENRKDDSYYDLLASEVRLGVFVAIAQGKLPQESWFALGRLLTNSGGDPILLSWSGSMFEYLMPQLVMPAYENTLLYQTNKATVKRQIEYAGQRGIPWGISESGYNMVDANLNYQYRAFGVPGLGLKRGLEEDLVIAPYASMLALMVMPAKACANLKLLSDEGFEGEFGFYEAVDYTNIRQPRGKTNTIVQSFMVHHQGMGLLSLAYVLLNKPMQQRFSAELRFQATLLLLQERIPRATLFYSHTADIIETHTATADTPVRSITTANTVIPEIQLLSNGRYQVMVTNSGGGYSRWKDLAVTRWREDSTKDDRGIFCYIKDVQSGRFWSNTYQPTLHISKVYEAVFSQGHVEFRRQDFGIDTRTEIVISPEDDAEMRRIRITNRNPSIKILEITSYAEVVMATQASDEAHPAFSNLFVQTEVIPEHRAVFCTRRPRSEAERPPWMFHLMNVSGAVAEAVSYETDRLQFIGRGRTAANPQAMDHDLLSGKEGAVLDPIMSIRYRISIKPGQTVTIDLIYGISETKEGCEGLMHKYQDKHLKNRAFELSWTHSHVLLRQINATEADAQLYDRLAASIIYSNPDLRADSSVILNNFRGQSGLWSHSISGDLPVILLHIYEQESMELVRQMIQAHAYWRLKGLEVDLVIWNEDHGAYRQLLQDQILSLISAEAINSAPGYSKPGNVFVKSTDQLSSEDRILFESVARIIIYDSKGTLSEQVNMHYAEKILPPLLEHKPVVAKDLLPSPVLALPTDLLFFNGTGGFTSDGKEYKIITDKRQTTPAPWVNVIANPSFGTVVSESGSAYTWAVNAHEYRITPWSNDPVSDVGGEAFYLRDEESGAFWSPAPFPTKWNTPYIITHGFGYTIFEHKEQGISSEMCMFVDKELPVKFIVLKVKNSSGRERKFSATGFMEIILGDVRAKTNMHVISEFDEEAGALLLRNRYNTAFTERVAFFSVNGASQQSFTADRSAFIGRNRNLEDPQALHRKKLSGRSGAGMDPCAALQVKFDLLDSEEKDIIFMLGSEENTRQAKSLILKFADKELVMESLQHVKIYWKELLGAVKVTTPDQSLNILVNGWLTYQTLACRIFARSGFYQSGGAFGFRDQLQDVLALLPTEPGIARQQILLSASRQFAEGDVQHWWHPPEGRGVRTHCSDDLLWLPFVVSRYLATTGEKDILDVSVGFLESRLLHPEEDSVYDLPVNGNLQASLYEHCIRAIKYSLRYGQHGMPLIGSGDWNDGMDQVGNKGKGESVWMAFFLYDVLQRFSVVANSYGDTAFSNTCKMEAAQLQLNTEIAAWDGEWYRRAYFDDGSPLGSKENKECSIDAVAQSWSVLSGAGEPERTTMAMASLDKHLVRRDLKLIQLLDPPFNNNGPNPGYIKGYVPGVRENGGQYSHVAIWALMAFAALGNREKVWELFDMIRPLNHTSDAAAIQVYKVEPYVMAADIYANESHKGRGGWTWYTGSSGWMYQFIISSLLGMELQADHLYFKPCFPLSWPSVTIAYHYGTSVYNITVFQVANGNPKTMIKLVDDGLEHDIDVYVSI